MVSRAVLRCGLQRKSVVDLPHYRDCVKRGGHGTCSKQWTSNLPPTSCPKKVTEGMHAISVSRAVASAALCYKELNAKMPNWKVRCGSLIGRQE